MIGKVFRKLNYLSEVLKLVAAENPSKVFETSETSVGFPGSSTFLIALDDFRWFSRAQRPFAETYKGFHIVPKPKTLYKFPTKFCFLECTRLSEI
jgi:hypothetical protein